ncbi:MAG TPA: Crp/Fnr family transcriptional regulator [Bradyrhizobium sp.]|nr:Crp/Fnr family transcriptional regulator [Bradyrhizobium sp.]
MQKSNQLMALFSQADAALLQPHLRPVFLEQQQVLVEAGHPIQSIYFPLDAIVSLVVGLSTGEIIEVAMVGRDGAACIGAALDGRIALSRAIVQLEGDALVCDVGALKNIVAQSPGMVSILMRHEQLVYSQAQQSAACMAAHDLEARLCRWLLRARDLVETDTLHFTQEFLAEMLGVRRSSVSVVAHTLQQAGMIKYSRGRIQIVDIGALRETVCECYGTVRSHHEMLLGEASQAGHA